MQTYKEQIKQLTPSDSLVFPEGVFPVCTLNTGRGIDILGNVLTSSALFKASNASIF
jgi:hypothetical protein